MTIDPVNAIPRPPQLAAYRSDKGQAMNIEFRAKPTDIAVVGAGIMGVSQTLLEAAITQPRPVFSCFVNLLQSEEARKQIILVIDGPAA